MTEITELPCLTRCLREPDGVFRRCPVGVVIRRRVSCASKARMQTLRHVLWMGGPPGAGKSSVAQRIARRHGLRHYNADTRTWQHRDRALRAGNAAALRWEAMTPEERWVGSSPDEMLEMSLHGERGQMVIDDLRALPDAPLIVADGSVLPAWAVSRGFAEPTRAIWLIPTPEFQRARLTEQGVAAGPTALYGLLRETIAREATQHDAPVLVIDGRQDVDEVVAAVEQRFAEALAAGSCAETRVERRALLREMNEAVVSQVRDRYDRAWAHGDAETVVREFVCECGDAACEATVLMPVGAAASGPVLVSH